jgi:hypothetical protein
VPCLTIQKFTSPYTRLLDACFRDDGSSSMALMRCFRVALDLEISELALLDREECEFLKQPMCSYSRDIKAEGEEPMSHVS